MANKKVSELTELSEAPANNDIFIINDVSDDTGSSAGTTKKITYQNLISGISSGGGSSSQTTEYLSVSRTSYDVTNDNGNVSQMQAFELDLSTTNKIEIKPKEGYPDLWINFENVTVNKFYIVEILITGDPIYMFNFGALLNIHYAMNKVALPPSTGSKYRKSYVNNEDGGYPNLTHQNEAEAILIQVGFQLLGGSITIYVDPSLGSDQDPNTEGTQHGDPFYNTNGDKFFNQDFNDAYSQSAPYYILDANGNRNTSYIIYTYPQSNEIGIYQSGGSFVMYSIDDFTVVNTDQEGYVTEMTIATEPSWKMYEDYRYFRTYYPQYGNEIGSNEVATPR